MLDKAERTVPPYTVLVSDPAAITSLAPEHVEDYSGVTVVQTVETARRYTEDVAPGVALADQVAMARIAQRWELSKPPENGAPFQGPSLILTGRQDAATGYADAYPLLDHYPRASFAVLDRAGHNLQFEAPGLFEALVAEWLDRVAEARRSPTS